MRMTPLLAAILAAPLAVTPALAQDTSSQSSDSSSDSSQSDSSSQSNSSSGSSSSGSGDQSSQSSSAQPEEDTVVVSVGDTDIMTSDVIAAVQALPPQMQQQPAEQLVPMAVEQLVLRELILQEAESQNLSEDPQVQELANSEGQTMENAIVQVYVQQRLEGAVTDEAVQQAYEQVQQSAEGEVPPLDQVRPQIEQQLRAQRLNEVRNELLSGDTEIVYYGPDGEEVQDPAEAMDMQNQSGGSGSSSSGSGSTDSGSSSDSSDSSSGGSGN